jgi:hypothetical protein
MSSLARVYLPDEIHHSSGIGILTPDFAFNTKSASTMMIASNSCQGSGNSQLTNEPDPVDHASVEHSPPLSREISTDDESPEAISPPCGLSALAALPNELFDHLLEFLDHPCPSEVNWHQRPDLCISKSEAIDLKNLSLVSKSLRALTLRRLFAHVCLDPNQSPAFLDFVDQYTLAPHIRSIIARMTAPCRLILHPLWWARLLNVIPALTFTIICPPYVFAEFASTSIVDVDSWAFNMPFHVIRFRQSKLAALRHTSFNDDHDLFGARPWTEFSINEGSCLKVYSQYEYFLRRTPSLMNAALLSPSPGLLVMLAQLKKFTYTAIFPFYNHVDEVLKSIRKMWNLKHLRFRLCPDPGSSVIDDELADSKGHIDISDAWMEFNTGYSLVAHTARLLSVDHSLEEFQVEDVAMEGIKDALIASINAITIPKMAHQGDGLWTRIPFQVKNEQNIG